ncbi:MAG TPA: beta-1,3-glucanase family protein [Candidatus Saccharimonadales bacterium]|nr:beta-1,3-glucanase family protein [Candidatus Saccharimonadales bacterium]
MKRDLPRDFLTPVIAIRLSREELFVFIKEGNYPMPPLKVSFTNLSNQEDVWIGFLAESLNIKNLADRSPIEPLAEGRWYSLAELSQGVSVTSFSGRIYVAYGVPWTVEYPGYEPGQTPVDPNFYLRYDKMEMTFTGQSADVADLTSIDYWSIAMTLNTYYSGTPVQTVAGLLGSYTATDLYNALNALTTPPKSGLTGPSGPDGAPLPALVPGEYVQFPGGPLPGKAFARIIGPGAYASITPAGIPVQPYDLFSEYLQYLLTTFGPGTGTSVISGLGNGVIAKIQGQFAGVGPNPPPSGPRSPQFYDLNATIDTELNITLTGTCGEGAITMLYTITDLQNPSGIYGANAPFYLTLADGPVYTTPDNDVYGWISGDLFAGINAGLLGSQELGGLPSQDWFDCSPAQLFGSLQSNPLYYNQWAATLSQYSNAYNFAFSDRFAPVFASLDPAKVNALEIVLEPDVSL